MLRYICLLTACLTSSSAAAQSFEYVHGGTAQRVVSTRDDSAWFTLTGGGIRYTADGGATFSNAAVPDGVRGTLRGLQVTRDTQGPFAYCVGDGGVVLFSTDQGQTWSQLPVVMTPSGHPVSPDVAPDLWDVWFWDRDNGWIVGFENTVLRTTNGGQSWSDISPQGHAASDNPEWYRIHAWSDEEFITVADNGWVAILRPMSTNTIAFTIDPFFWCYAPQLSQPPHNLELWDIQFVGDVGFTVGGVVHNDGYAFVSTDRGSNWSLYSPCYDYLGSATGVTPPTLYGVEMFGDPDYAAKVGYGSSAFLTGTSGTTTAPPDCPTCPTTGEAWIQVVMDSDANGTVDPTDDFGMPPMLDITSSTSHDVGYAVGDFGHVRRSDDQGVSWFELAGLHRGRVACGAFADLQNGVVAGQLWRVFSTSDGGDSFTLEYSPAIPNDPFTGSPYNGHFLGAAHATSNARAVVAGERGRLAVRDASGVWTDRSIGAWASGPELTSALISADGLGMLVGGASLGGATLRISADGGATAFTGLTLTHGGNPVLSKIVDMATDGTYVYYLTASKQVYVAALTSLTVALAAVPIQGTSAAPTALGVRSASDLYTGDAAGRIFRLNTSTSQLEQVTAVTPAELGGAVHAIAPVPGTSDWWFTGNAGMVLRYDGSAWTSPKSTMQAPVVGAVFFSATEGLLIGRKHDIARLVP